MVDFHQGRQRFLQFVVGADGAQTIHGGAAFGSFLVHGFCALDRISCRISIPELVPSLVAPAVNRSFACLRERIPPAALIWISGNRVARIRRTCLGSAPAGPYPVEVFMKSGRTRFATRQTRMISSSVK